MIENKTSILRLYTIAIFLMLFGVAIGCKLVVIQFLEGEELVNKINVNTIKYVDIEPIRGNIYSYDGSLLVTSLPKYEVRFDLVTVDSVQFYNNVAKLGEELANLYLGKSKEDWTQALIFAREQEERYYLINKKTTYKELQKLKTFPIFSLGKYKGGLIIHSESERVMPFGHIAERTIGEIGTRIGFEGAYNHYLEGEKGYQLMQKISGRVWKEIEYSQSSLPINGNDIFVTIDPLIQYFTHNALLEVVEHYEANYGCAIVMEVETGKIRAISNLSKTKKDTYAEVFNHAIHSRTEVGSTFKLISLIAALEDGCISLEDKIETGNGSHVFYGGKEMKDTKFLNILLLP